MTQGSYPPPPPPGTYPPPPAPGSYPPPPSAGQYPQPPAPGQYPPQPAPSQYPGQYPPQPAPSQYPGQYPQPPAPGQYPGQYPPPPQGQYPGQYPQPGQYAGSYPPGTWQQQPGQYGYGSTSGSYGSPPASPTNGLAIAALVLGIMGVFPIPGVEAILGIILGAISLNQIKATGGVQKGRGFAIAGIVLGSLWIAFFVAIIIAAIVSSHNQTSGALVGLL